MEDFNLAHLLAEGYGLKNQINELQSRLRQINLELAERAEYKAGSSTGHIAAGHIMAKITKRQNVKWDQALLGIAHKEIGTELFSQAFTFEFKPINSRQLKAWLESEDISDKDKKLVTDARTVTEGAPTVTYESIDDAN